MQVGDDVLVILSGNRSEGVMELFKVSFMVYDKLMQRDIVMIYNEERCLTRTCYPEEFEEQDGKYCLILEYL